MEASLDVKLGDVESLMMASLHLVGVEEAVVGGEADGLVPGLDSTG